MQNQHAMQNQPEGRDTPLDVLALHLHFHLDEPYAQVRVNYQAGCCDDGFSEYVPQELRGRVSDANYVAHIRRLNADVRRAGRWSWGILPGILGTTGFFCYLLVTLPLSYANNSPPSLSAILPWALLGGLCLLVTIFFVVMASIKRKRTLQAHERQLNEDMGGDTGLRFRLETKLKHAGTYWDPVHKRQVTSSYYKLTLVIEVGPPSSTSGSHGPTNAESTEEQSQEAV